MAAGGSLPANLVARRPAAVLEAIAEKFKSASNHVGWVQDSAANYEFGRFGTGLEAARAALAAAHGRRLRVLDAGCGSGGQLAELAELAEAAGAPVYLRGVTAEPPGSRIPARLAGRVRAVSNVGPEDTGEAPVAEETGLVDVRIYEGFSLENLCASHGADFVREDQRFDLILCSWTLFHLCDPLGTLSQLRGLLDCDGVLLANGVFFHVAGAGPEEAAGLSEGAPREDMPTAGSIESMSLLLQRLPAGLEYDISGEPVRWVSEDPEDEWAPGEWLGGYRASLCWCGSGREAKEVELEVAAVADFTGEVMEKVWQLASGSQYMVAAYKLL